MKRWATAVHFSNIFQRRFLAGFTKKQYLCAVNVSFKEYDYEKVHHMYSVQHTADSRMSAD